MMKKQILLLAALAVLAGCAEQMEPVESLGGKLTAHIGDAETRVSFDESSGKFSWTAGDKIDVHTTAGYKTAELDVNGCFSLERGSVRDGYAIYPTGIVSGTSDLTLQLPASYDVAAEGMVDFYPSPMVALNDPAADDIWFYHAGAVARLVFAELPAETRTIVVTLDQRITGSFSVADPGTDHPVIATDGTATGASVTFNLAGAPVVPFALNVPIPTGTYNSITASVRNASNAEVLPPFVSARVRSFPRGRGRKINFDGSWDYTFTLTDPAEFSYSGGTSTDASVRSFRTNRVNGSVEPVSWVVSGYYSNADGTTPYDGTDAANPPAWLTSFSGAGTGSETPTGEVVTINYTYGDNEVVKTYSGEGQTINNVIAANGTVGSSSQYMNLSNPSNMTSDVIAESANSYIVNAQGWYRIPLVMGNGVMNNAVNANAAVYRGASSHEEVVLFKDYKGNNITSPYLHTIGTPTSAFVVWEDTEGLIEVADNSSFALAGSPITQRGGVYWLNFHVAQALQGNAVIAVADADGTIMWSWHIWVTGYVPRNYPAYSGSASKDIAVTNHAGDHTYQFMAFDLGWNVSGMHMETVFHPGDVYVLLTQSESEETALMHIQQEGKTLDPVDFGNYAPYFQWGRKDALWPGNGLDATIGGYVDNPLIFDADEPVWYGRFPTLVDDPRVTTLDEAIRNPAVFYGNDNEGTSWLGEQHAFNLWNAAIAGGELDYMGIHQVVKTIYDPSPAGYLVPPEDAYSTFTTTGGIANGDNYIYCNVPDVDATFAKKEGMTFYTQQNAGPDTPTIYFPVVGTRKKKDGKVRNIDQDAYYWSSTPSATATSRNYTHGHYFYFCTNAVGDQPHIDVRPNNNGARADGMTLRPVADPNAVVPNIFDITVNAGGYQNGGNPFVQE